MLFLDFNTGHYRGCLIGFIRQKCGYALILQDFSKLMLEKYGKIFGTAA